MDHTFDRHASSSSFADALSSGSYPDIILRTSQLLENASITNPARRAEAFLLRATARHRMGLHRLARADALSACSESCHDPQLSIRIAYVLYDLALTRQAQETLAKARQTLQTTATSSATAALVLQKLAEAEAALIPSAATGLPDRVLFFIFAAIDDLPTRARCMSVCRRWYNIIQYQPHLWDSVRLWNPFRLPTLAYYIDDDESNFPEPRMAFARSSAALLFAAHHSFNRLRHVSLDLRGRPVDQEQLVRVWATLRRSAPTLRTLNLCFTHIDTGAHTHLSALLRACTRLEELRLYYAPAPRTDVEQPYQPLPVDLRLDDSNMPDSPLRIVHLFLPECDIIFDKLLIRRFATLTELTLVRGVFEPVELSWLCALLRRIAPTLRTLQLGCAIDRAGNPAVHAQLVRSRIEFPRLEVYRCDTTEYDPDVRRLQATLDMPALRELELCNLDPEAIILLPVRTPFTTRRNSEDRTPSPPPLSEPAQRSSDEIDKAEHRTGLISGGTTLVASAAPSVARATTPTAPSVPSPTLTGPRPRSADEPDATGVTDTPRASPSPSPFSSAAAASSSTPQRHKRRREPFPPTGPPSNPPGILNVGGALERLESLTLRTVSLQEDAAVVAFLRRLSARSVRAVARLRVGARAGRRGMEGSLVANTVPAAGEGGGVGMETSSVAGAGHPVGGAVESPGPDPVSMDERADVIGEDEDHSSHEDGEEQQEQQQEAEDEEPTRMLLLPSLRSITIQDHVSLTNELIVQLVEARRAYVDEEEAALATLLRNASAAGAAGVEAERAGPVEGAPTSTPQESGPEVALASAAVEPAAGATTAPVRIDPALRAVGGMVGVVGAEMDDPSPNVRAAPAQGQEVTVVAQVADAQLRGHTPSLEEPTEAANEAAMEIDEQLGQSHYPPAAAQHQAPLRSSAAAAAAEQLGGGQSMEKNKLPTEVLDEQHAPSQTERAFPLAIAGMNVDYDTSVDEAQPRFPSFFRTTADAAAQPPLPYHHQHRQDEGERREYESSLLAQALNTTITHDAAAPQPNKLHDREPSISSAHVLFRPLSSVRLINCPRISEVELRAQLVGKLEVLSVVETQ
ncbi:hypothetical protein V8E36_002493 [Tilletia maclaganii]